MEIKCVVDCEPDIEAFFEFNGTRSTPVKSGYYRPVHLINNGILTSGLHQYFGVQTVEPNGTAKGTITFICPEAYPHCLWVGKKINIQEGSKIVGYATVLKILNPILLLD